MQLVIPGSIKQCSLPWAISEQSIFFLLDNHTDIRIFIKILSANMMQHANLQLHNRKTVTETRAMYQKEFSVLNQLLDQDKNNSPNTHI